MSILYFNPLTIPGHWLVVCLIITLVRGFKGLLLIQVTRIPMSLQENDLAIGLFDIFMAFYSLGYIVETLIPFYKLVYPLFYIGLGFVHKVIL